MFTDSIFQTIPKFQDFNYWFIPLTEHTIQIVDNSSYSPTDSFYDAIIADGKLVDAELILDDTTISAVGSETASNILADWAKYKARPEYSLLNIHSADDTSIDMVNKYEWLFVGAIFMKECTLKHDPDSSWHKITRCLDWLRSTDFYSCPASTQYHDSHPQGLLHHSLIVAEKSVELQSLETFKSARLWDAVFVSLVHDWCKIGLYVPYLKNVKDEATNQWVQVNAYKYADDRTICLGHGVSSMYLVMKFFNITIEVALAIRHHMGRWNCPDSEVNELQQANRNYPLVHLIQFADQLAIVQY